MPTVYACELLVAFIWCLCKKYESFKNIGYGIYMYQYSYLVEQVEVLLSQFEWKSRDSPTETRLTDRYRSTCRFFVIRGQFPARAVTGGAARKIANDVTYTYARSVANQQVVIERVNTHFVKCKSTIMSEGEVDLVCVRESRNN